MLTDGGQGPPRPLSTPLDGGAETPVSTSSIADSQGTHPAYHTLQQANIDLDGLPLSFLENYPYPAFVLLPGVPLRKENHTSTFSLHNISPLCPVWSNPCWRRLSGNCDNLLECLSLDNVRRLSFWLSGAFGAFTSSLTWAERRAEEVDENNPMSAPPTVTLEFEFHGTRTRLTLAKTLSPLYQVGTDGSRSLISTHILAIITATPHGRLEFFPRRQGPQLTPTCSNMSSTVSQSTSVDNSSSGPSYASYGAFAEKVLPTALDIPQDIRGRPLVVHSDGSVNQRISNSGLVKEDSAEDENQKLLTTTNWDATPVGRREKWPLNLQLVVSFIMSLPFPASVWWGSDMCLIYNHLYGQSLPNHPHVFGQAGTTAWGELWPTLGSLSELVLNGTPVAKEDDFCLATDQDAHVRESYRLQCWVPIKSEKRTEGLLHIWVDRTEKVIRERRAQLLYLLAERGAMCSTIPEFDRAIIELFTPHSRDIPFAMLYHVERTKTPSSLGPSDCSYVRLRYGGGVGVPADHKSAPRTLELPVLTTVVEGRGTREEVSDAARARYHSVNEPWPFVEAIETGRPVLVQDCSGIVEGFPVRIWDELPTSALVIPIVRVSDKEMSHTVLVVGLSDRLPYDSVYQRFLREVALELSSHYAAVRTHENQLRKNGEGAARAAVQGLSFLPLTHEIFAGLSLISGPLDDYLVDMEPGRGRKQLEMSRRNLSRMTRWLSTLTEMSSLEERRIQGSFTAVNFGELTANVADTFRKPFETPRIAYIVETDVTQRDVFLDHDKFERILFTLIGNAFRFTVDGSVKVTAGYQDEVAVVTVEDTGVGIEPDLVKLLNQPATIQEGIDQTIIAMTYCKTLVKMQGGTVCVESSTTAPSGTKVTVGIPLGSAHLSPESINRPVAGGPEVDALKEFHRSVMDDLAHCQWGWVGSSVEPDESHTPVPLADNHKDRDVNPLSSLVRINREDVILIVDDSTETRRYLRGIFEPFCKVVEVATGEEALDTTQTTMPDLVIADAVLPGMSGFELVEALRQGTRSQQMLPIILLTGPRSDALPEVSFGADDYLARPFNARELIARSHMQLQLGKKRRALEAGYEQRTQELRMLTDLLPVGIFRTTMDGWFLYTNSKWHDLTGYPRNAPIVNWGDYLVPEQMAPMRNQWAHFLDSDEPTTGGECAFKNGTSCAFLVLKLGGFDNAPPGILGCIIDITDRLKNEELQKLRVEEALRAQAEAEEARRQQEELIDITSHEIRNPISNMMQCASLVRANLLQLQSMMKAVLEDGDDAPPFKPQPFLFDMMSEDLEALQSIYNCGLTQERISNDVLSLGKLQLGKLEIFHVATDIVRETQKLIAVFQPEAKMNLVELTLDVSPAFEELGVFAAMIDPVRYSQIVTNLVSNAIRFTSNSPTRRVRVSLDVGTEPPAPGTMTKPVGGSGTASPNGAERKRLFLYGSVADTGPGMTTAERASLFQRFSQASAKTHTVFGGSGLGLFVCRKITERMGGGIDVESQAGHGSTFQFYLQADSAPAVADSPLTPPSSDSPRRQVSAHVLVVEDNVLNCKVLARQFSKVGIRVESVGNGSEALERLRTTQRRSSTDRYDVVLMDLEMPVMDGYTATRRLREDEAAGSLVPTSVIAFTGNARHATIDAKMADFDDVVVKPYRINEMLNRIEEAVKHGPRPHPITPGDGTPAETNGEPNGSPSDWVL